MTGCQSGLQHAPPIRVPPSVFPGKWSCTALSELKGPIDVSLPPFARVQDVHMAAGDGGQVGIVWRREVDDDSLDWDPTIERFRVRKTDLTLARSSQELLPPAEPELVGRKMPPMDREVFAQDEFVAMAVIGPEAVEGYQLFGGYPPDCGWTDPMQDVGYADGRWYAVFNLYPSKDAQHDDGGIALAKFDASGWSKPTVVVPKECAHPIWSFSEGTRVELFWAEEYLPFLAFPDSGLERQRVKHAAIEPGREGKVQTVYECPMLRLLGFAWNDWVIRAVRLEPNRYELLVERHYWGLLRELRAELRHVANVLSAWPTSSGALGRYWGFGGCVAVVLPGRRLQVIWDEDPEGGCGRPGRLTYRIMEVHYDGRSWSAPREIAQPSHVSRYSLAATAVQAGDLSAVLVVWQDEGEHLVYAVGSGSGQWSRPVTTSLVVGERIWLAGAGDTVTLLTEIDRNLRWCRLLLTPADSATQAE